MALNLGSGDFDTKVVFKKPASVKNDQGDKAKTFTQFLVTWAAVRSFDQKRIVELGKPELLDTVLLYIRYAQGRDEIDKDWLIEMKGKAYHIFSKPTVRESGLQVLEITAKAK